MYRIAIVLLALGCGGAPAPAPAKPTDPEVAGLIRSVDRELAARPGDDLLIYLRAWLTVEAGSPGDALPFFERLDAAGWDVPFGDRIAAAFAGEPRFRAIAQRVEGRATAAHRSTTAFTIAGPDLIPEGIAVDTRTGTFYVGSIRKRTIVAVDAKGAARPFVPPRHEGQLAVIGVRVDEARDVLWATSYASDSMEGYTAADRTAGSVRAYALGDGALRRKIEFADGAVHLPNDLAIAPDGTVYVTDSESGRLYRVPPDRDALEPVTPAATFMYPNGIAFGREGKLYVAHLAGIAIVDPATGSVRRLEPAPRVILGRIDGLQFDGERLVAVQSLGQRRLVAIALDAAGERATKLDVLENDARLLELPTTAAIWQGALYTIANSQLHAFGPEGLREGQVLRDPQIVRTPL